MRITRMITVLLMGILLTLVACSSTQSPALSPKTTLPPPALPQNQLPVLSSLTPWAPQCSLGERVRFSCFVFDPDGDALAFAWTTTAGNFEGTGAIVTWIAPSAPGTYEIAVIVSDGRGGSARASAVATVLTNRPPFIMGLVPGSWSPVEGTKALIGRIVTCEAVDPDGDTLSFDWQASEGTISGVGREVTWLVPAKPGRYVIKVIVSDSREGKTSGSVVDNLDSVTVTDGTYQTSGNVKIEIEGH